MMIKVVSGLRRPAQAPAQPASRRANPRLLPPRSMVGQLPLEQHIGVRIPGGQPKRTLLRSSANFLELLLNKLNRLF